MGPGPTGLCPTQPGPTVSRFDAADPTFTVLTRHKIDSLAWGVDGKSGFSGNLGLVPGQISAEYSRCFYMELPMDRPGG